MRLLVTLQVKDMRKTVRIEQTGKAKQMSLARLKEYQDRVTSWKLQQRGVRTNLNQALVIAGHDPLDVIKVGL